MKIGAVARIALLVGVGFAPPMALAARPAPTASRANHAAMASAKVHQATGEVLAASASSLLLLHDRGWAKQKLAFTLTPETEKSASLNKGERIVVFYRDINGHRVAARIRSALPYKHRTGAAKVHQATGEVISASASSLVLLHARGRGKQRMLFTLTPQTEKSVPLTRGARVVVFYREIGGRRVVARIRAPSPSRRAR